MKTSSTLAVKSAALLVALVFIALLLIIPGTLKLEAFRHRRMTGPLNELLAADNSPLVLEAPPVLSFFGEGSGFRLDKSPAVYRYTLVKRAGTVWVFMAQSGGVSVLFYTHEHPAGSFTLPAPLGQVSRDRAHLLPAGLVEARLTQIQKLSGGHHVP